MSKVRLPEPEGFDPCTDRMPSQAVIAECFSYDADTGLCTWKERPRAHFKTQRAWKIWNARYSNTVVKTKSHGYIRTSIGKETFYLHRLIWKLVTGIAPSVVDHINGDTTDNRFCNLRSTTQAVNVRNARRRHGGVTGVYEERKGFGWYAQISVQGKVKSKLFKTRHEAVEWRVSMGRSAGYTDRHLGVTA